MTRTAFENDQKIYLEFINIRASTNCSQEELCRVVADISLDGTDVHPDDPALGYRLHQWQADNDGVIGASSAIEMVENDAEDGQVWAEHASEEVGNWEVFLPTLWKLYQVIEREDISPCYSLKLKQKGIVAQYEQK